eukprot:scaffold248413_cov39-Cyclotella_meneghiniana.AAC.4
MKALQWRAEVGGGYVYAYFWYGRPTPVEVWTRPKSRTLDGEECVREVRGDNDDLRYRVAFVMRRCSTVREFYTDTSTIRLGAEMIEAMRTSISIK